MWLLWIKEKSLKEKTENTRLATGSYMQVVSNIKHKESRLTSFITQMKPSALF